MALSFDIRAARLEDRESVTSLLSQAALPLDGVDAGFPAAYVVACVDSVVVGAAGLEAYGAAALLRSVVVHDVVRSQGVGEKLVAECLARARALGLQRVFLLTTTAASYFEGLGFAPASRHEAPQEMLASVEFAGACPASATCLARAP